MQNLNNNQPNQPPNQQLNQPPNQQLNQPPNQQNKEKMEKDYKQMQKEEDKKRKKLQEKMELKNTINSYRSIRQLGKEKYPVEIHYSKLLIDEKKKKKEKIGILFTQKSESKMNFIENIKEKFSIDENLFISTDYDIETLEEEDSIESNMVKEEKEAKEKKKIKPKKMFKSATFETMIESFKNSNIPEKYHKLLSVLNLSYQDYNNFNKIYNFEIKNESESEMFAKMVEYIEETLAQKIPNIKKIVNLNTFLKKYLDSFKKIVNFSIEKNIVIVPDNMALFILFHNLVIEKSFWMLIPEKNREFLLFLIERILEIVDERNSEIKYYITQKDEDDSNKNFEGAIKNILKEYIGNLDDGYIKNFIGNNNLDEEEGLIKNYELKIIPDRKYYEEKSFSLKWEKISTSEKIKIFNLFSDLNDKENLIILLISTGSKGVIQYLLISSLLIIHNQKNDKKFSKFLTNKQINGYSLIQSISNDFKEKIFVTTGDFESKTKNPYQRFLEFIWAEYQTIHAKTKKELKKEKKEKKEAVQKHYENIRLKKAMQQEANYNIKQKGKLKT